ncbi:MAG: hypothetical protein A2045_10315 [Rhodocyclales bacterium GWA2_65_20]|nr:MAG: hypothetical protein A2045_10315 [Rhodocyclales bacterium GWA2_65_20]
MNDRLRALLTFAGLVTLLLVILVAASLYSFREFSLRSAEERARTAAEIVRVGLTEAMANGTIGLRAQLLARLGRVNGLEEVRVVRGPSVVRQFGAGMGAEHAVDDTDRAVLASGRPVYELLDDNQSTYMMRATIPYVAEQGGQPDCVQCHKVQVGEVLGAITLKISLAETRARALNWVAVLVGIMGSFAVVALFLLRRQYQPMADVALKVDQVVGQAACGDFGTRIDSGHRGEAGAIAAGVNRLMDALDSGVGTISNRVEQLMQYDLPRSRNMLLSTLEMVEGLVDANRFKQAIEEDETKQEIYTRLARVIGENFDLGTFSIYEVANSKNHMRPVVVDHQADADIKWCDPQILIRSEACRARRTGRMVSSVNEPHICRMFSAQAQAEGKQHVCLPMIQSGNVGCVVQLVSTPETSVLVRMLVPFLRVYLRETAPVLEAKRLMESLRESTLRDAMTGLYNRHFIEAYMETLVSAVKRRKTHLGVLMLDVDHFKKVNDTYGHDAGDKVLVAVANVLKESLRSSDLIIRYGGEEFIALLQDTDRAGAMFTAEKIRHAVESLKIQIGATALTKTISIGVADFPEDTDEFWEVVKYADVALYAAKGRGRNRVVSYTHDLVQAPGANACGAVACGAVAELD